MDFSFLIKSKSKSINSLCDTVKTIEVEECTLTGEELRVPKNGAAILWGKKRGDLIIKFAIVGSKI